MQLTTLENGTNLVYLKEQLYHKHLKTTARYIHLCQSYHKRSSPPSCGHGDCLPAGGTIGAVPGSWRGVHPGLWRQPPHYKVDPFHNECAARLPWAANASPARVAGRFVTSTYLVATANARSAKASSACSGRTGCAAACCKYPTATLHLLCHMI